MAQTFNNGESNASIRTKLNANAGEIDENTADITALDTEKAPIDSPTFTGTVGGITKGMVGLGNVDNTTDANKPISTATQTALNAKAPIANPTFTGTVNGITKTMVGLGAVDNTSDAEKPVSSATQTALNSKAPIANPTFTGTVNGITKAMVGLSNVDNTSDINKPISALTQNALNDKATPGDIDTALENTKIWFDSDTFEGKNYPVPVDPEPAVGTEDNPIKSKGAVIVATVVESGNANAVSSNAVFNAIEAVKGGETRTMKQIYDELYALIASGLTTPLAPTDFIVDDDDNTGAFTNTGGKTDADTEITLDGGTTQSANTDNPFDVPDLNYAPGQVGVRYKAVVGVSNPSGWLFNSEPYTASGASTPINTWRVEWDAEQSLSSPNTILFKMPDTVGFGIGYADLKVLETGICTLEAQGDDTTNGIGKIYMDDDNDSVNNPSLPLYYVGFADSVETGRKIITKDFVVYDVDPGVNANLVKIRIRTDSTSLYYEYSIDGGLNWVTLDTLARTGIPLYAKVAVENSFGIRNCNNINQSGLIPV